MDRRKFLGNSARQLVMLNVMGAATTGNPLMAKQTLSQIQPGKGLDTCKDCRDCTGKCQYRVPIANRISDLKEIYS